MLKQNMEDMSLSKLNISQTVNVMVAPMILEGMWELSCHRPMNRGTAHVTNLDRFSTTLDDAVCPLLILGILMISRMCSSSSNRFGFLPNLSTINTPEAEISRTNRGTGSLLAAELPLLVTSSEIDLISTIEEYYISRLSRVISLDRLLSSYMPSLLRKILRYSNRSSFH